MTGEKTEKRIDWLAWILGIGNFVFVTLVGAYFAWKTNDLEEKLSTIQTAGQYIEIVAAQDAPDYAKTLALSAIFDEGLLSRDLLLEAAYRIEDDAPERTVVGPLLYRIADSNQLLDLPIGFVGNVSVDQRPGSVAPELTIHGWAIDNQGWAPENPLEPSPGTMLQIELEGTLRCEYPLREGLECDVEIFDREDISSIFGHYPNALTSGFATKLPLADTPLRFSHLVVRLLDARSHARVIYSRCVDLAEVGKSRLPEKAFPGSRCETQDRRSPGREQIKGSG